MITKLTAYTICFVFCVLWAMFERYSGIGITDQVFLSIIFGLLIIFHKGDY